MEATNILQQEHCVIERVLASMEAGANFLEIGESVEPEFFLKSVEFFKGFTDGCHHKKEEEVLFVKMAEHGIAVENGPLGVMYSEHELGRMTLHTIREMAETIQNGKAHSPELLLENVRGFINLYRKHIVKEDRVLFPIADRIIPAQGRVQILSGFEQVEKEGTGEEGQSKYLALAESLEKSAAGYI